ncbi:ABC transporter permease [Flagellimonas sp.]|uniref:ABC transporter permease n=1 Tax=Flagellimonas sp. TaxID=2058762 RepID=UPI003B51AB23
MMEIKSYIRHLLKNKLYGLVTVLGFAISMTFVLLLSIYIQEELAVDEFHVHKDRIYRMENEAVDFSPPIAQDLKNSIPEIETFTRVLDSDGRISTADSQKMKFDYLGVDDSFFEMFSFPLIKGRPKEVLQTPNSIVLSKSLALRLFGTLDVVDKQVSINTEHKFMVTGIMDDFPKNTHFKPQDAIVNFKAFKTLWGFETILEEYGFASVSMYFLAKPNTNLSAKAPEILERFKKEYWLYKDGWAHSLVFTPLQELYFSPKEGNGTQSNSKTLVVVLSIIVLLILILAIGNYINLTIAQATFRGKEVAIKKLLGSSKGRLLLQFVRESMLLTGIALLLSLVLLKLVEPVFNSLLNTQIDLDAKIGFWNLLKIVSVFGFIGAFSGIVPALKISSFRPIEVVRGQLRKKAKTVYGKVFITFQYTVTIGLLICSWIIVKQTNFLRSKELGFSKDNIVQIEYLGAMNEKATIKNALLNIPGVEDVSLTWQSPLDGGSNQTFDYNGKPMSFQEIAIDSSFFSVFDIKMTPTQVAKAQNGVYLNEAAISALEITDDPVSFKMEQFTVPIIGITNNFNFNHLRENIGPLMLRDLGESFYPQNIFVRINGKGMFKTLDEIKSTYAGLLDKTPFEVRFVDETINNWYINEERTGKIIGYFTLLSFIISVMGIVAMSVFYMQQRRKEVGIRKVNGASITQILSMLNKDYIKWVGVAFVLAVPISWYALQSWLQGFAYKTTLSWWVFALSGLTALCIALLTVSWQSIKTASANPVEALRDE